MDSFLKTPKVRKLKPIHWLIIFVFVTLVITWMLVDTSSGIKYRHSVRHGNPADKVLNLDDNYRQKLQSLSAQMKAYCDRGSDIVFGHNLLINDQIFNDYVFHECGGHTWLNARIEVKTEKQVKCQEEFASIYRSVPRAKSITMTALDVDSWTERVVSGESKTACVWQHAVDILDRKWVGL